MRIFLFLPAFLLSGNLFAQQYQQNAPPVQQVQAATDCYTRNLDYGNAALRRGEANEALAFFNEAKNCPDAQGNSRRQSELSLRIEKCEKQLGLKSSASPEKSTELIAVAPKKRTFATEVPATRRNYPASAKFLKDTLDNCYQALAEEADRAFRLRFWEDAASMYRAAKNCSDADQNKRQRMSEKIIACREAAENELFAKQQEAERQARHAIAANLADDAQELLQYSDRSVAYRLADFANQYIAPDDNPDCVQAIFNAWYYQPPEDAKNRVEDLYHPVFCYELADNLGENTQVKFRQQKDGSQWLWAFVPKSGDMFAWVLPSMKMVQSYGTGEGNNYLGFDFSPDGELIFWGNKFFDLRRGTRSVRVDVPVVARWCFSGRGDEFFYENVAEQKIMVLNAKEAFSQQMIRKGAKNANTIQAPVVSREIITGVPAGLLDMAYVDGKFWLGFQDRIEILSKSGPGRPWSREKVIPFEGVTIQDAQEQKALILKMFPKDGFAVLSSNQHTWSIPLGSASADSTTRKAKAFESLYPLAGSGNAHQIACQYNGNYHYNAFWILDALSGDTLLRQRIPAYTGFDPFKGSFSQDKRWVAASSFYGNINVWALQDVPTVWSKKLAAPPEEKTRFSPNGTRLFATFSDTLGVYNAIGAQKQEYLWKNDKAPLLGVSDHWALVQVSPDSAEARQLDGPKRMRFPLKNEGYAFLYAFDSRGENYVAYLSAWNKIEVRSLKTGTLLATKILDGGSIGEMQFVPGTDQLLLVQHISEGELEISTSSVKLWSPLRPAEKPRAFRLHEYPVQAITLDASGKQAAFSNGSDIRIFDLKNIENEALKIRAAVEENVQAIAFRENSNLLAAAYSSGKVIFWNYQTGQASLQLQPVPSRDLYENGLEIEAIGFSQEGAVLQLAISDGRLLAYALDPSYIRSVVQDENRQLQSFSNEQIIRFDLEAALYYPGNFERLAESGDAPLVRSFFRHFRGQALESNNIVQVRDYCERAFYLYERLDGNTQELWKPDMSIMYEDYARKLLLRGNVKEAISVVNFIKLEFGTEPVLLKAHIALLERDYSKASTLYSNYFLLDQNTEGPQEFGLRWHFDNVEKEMTLLRDYELVDSVQSDCFCGTVCLSDAFASFCPQGKSYPTDFLTPSDRLRWEIAQKRNAANNTLRNAEKVRLLELAFEKAKTLVRSNQGKDQAWLETITLELAASQLRWGVFENNSPEAFLHFDQSLRLLEENGAFKKLSDTSRLSLIMSGRLAWGKKLLESGKSKEALNQFERGIQSAQPLTVLAYASDTTLLIHYFDHLIGPIYEQMAKARLYLGQITEARQAYEQAATFYLTYGLNSLHLAIVAIMEQDETQAFLDFSGITSASEAAIAFYGISVLAEHHPDKRAQIEPFIPRLKEALRMKNPRLITAETDFWYANMMKEHYAAQSRWDSVIVWSNQTLQHAKRCREQINAEEYWTEYWLDEHINLAYYLLLGQWEKPTALAECIRITESAEDFLSKQDDASFYYRNRELLKANMGHALVLRNQPGDREKAIKLYQQFIQAYSDVRGYDNLDILQKDFRDLRRVGAAFPELPELEVPVNE